MSVFYLIFLRNKKEIRPLIYTNKWLISDLVIEMRKYGKMWETEKTSGHDCVIWVYDGWHDSAFVFEDDMKKKL